MATGTHSLLSCQAMEAGDDISRLHRLLEGLDDRRLIAHLVADRKGRRDVYPTDSEFHYPLSNDGWLDLDTLLVPSDGRRRLSNHRARFDDARGRGGKIVFFDPDKGDIETADAYWWDGERIVDSGGRAANPANGRTCGTNPLEPVEDAIRPFRHGVGMVRNADARSRGKPGDKGGYFLKMGYAGSEDWMTGHQYIFHNTIFRADEYPPTGGLGGNRIVKHTVSRNNILHVREPHNHSASENDHNTDNDFDYDLYSGRIPEGHEAHGIRGEPVYAPNAGYDPASKTGRFQVLDAYEQALKEQPLADRRFRVHAQVVAIGDLARFSELGVIPSMQPTHATSDMYWAEDRVGPERIKGAYAWRKLLNTGAIIPCGSDFPVEENNPMLGIYAAITRQDPQGRPAGGWYPEERMTREEALRGFTVWAAYAAFQEDKLGTIEAGKLADMVVLSKDILTVAPEEILTAVPEYTIVGGKIRYRRTP